MVIRAWLTVIAWISIAIGLASAAAGRLCLYGHLVPEAGQSQEKG